jgi:Tfp pilus assembly protein PilN
VPSPLLLDKYRPSQLRKARRQRLLALGLVLVLLGIGIVVGLMIRQVNRQTDLRRLINQQDTLLLQREPLTEKQRTQLQAIEGEIGKLRALGVEE